MATRKPATRPTVHSLTADLRALGRRHARGTHVPSEARDLDTLKNALKGAVGIEFATIPPYLTALWSFKDDLHPMASSLRNIVQEEMLHLALATNMLAAIGGRPRFNVGNPVYPTTLPLGVHPELTISLGGFSPAVLKVFMEIERPDNSDYKQWLKYAGDLNGNEPTAEDLTIGVFYELIQKAFHHVKPALSTDHQVSGPLSWMVLKDLDDVDTAIGIIQHQGEGSWGSPAEGWGDHWAHFWRFAEMKECKKLVHGPNPGQYTLVTPIPFDQDHDVWPVGEVPAGGYTDVKDHEVCELLHGFNVTYSELLDLFQVAWSEHGGQARLVHAIAAMFELSSLAKTLMAKQRPGEDKHYGPEFRYIPEGKR